MWSCYEKDDSGKIVKHVVLTDILGAEDHFGDMDLKIAGTVEGITGFQLDLRFQDFHLTSLLKH